MKVYTAKLSKDILAKIPEDERTVFMALAHVTNEINALLKCVLWSSDFSSDNTAKINGQVTLLFMFLKLLAGKLNEGYQLLEQTYFNRLSREYDPRLPEETRIALSKVKSYFKNKENRIRSIRRNFAFHYSPGELNAILPEVEEEELVVYLQTQGSANNLYYFAEVLDNKALLKLIACEEKEGFRLFQKEIIDVTSNLIITCDGIMDIFLLKYIPDIWAGSAQEVSFTSLPSRINLPWFIDTSDLEKEFALL